MRTARRAPAALLLLAAAGPATRPSTRPTTVPTFDAESVGQSVVLLGRAGRPLGEVITLVGVAHQHRDQQGGMYVAVQRIDGVATQQVISVRFNDTLIDGRTYSLRGYETGSFVGLRPAAYADDGDGPHLDLQTTDYHFDCYFQLGHYDKPKEMPAVTFAPADFVGRPALLAGTAANVNGVGWLVGNGWRLRSADDGSPWPGWMAGHPAEVDGVVRAGHGTDYVAEHAARRLVTLADQVGHAVELRGVARRGDDDRWWLDYRGERVELPDVAKAPGWEPGFDWTPVAVRGTLARPALPGPAEDGNPYVIRDATGSPTTLRAGEQPPHGD